MALALVLLKIYRFLLLIDIEACLHKLPLATSAAFPISIISLCCSMFTAKDSEVVDCVCEHENSLLLNSASCQLTSYLNFLYIVIILSCDYLIYTS